MKQMLKLVVVLIGVWCAWRLSPSAAQNVKDLTDHEPTTEELIEGLKRPGTTAPRPQMRGIDLTGTGTASPPRCTQYWQQVKGQTRGISLSADTSGIALTVTFPTNSAQLTPAAIQTLKNLGQALQSSDLASSCFQIEGHTDSIGSASYNQSLSQRRAQSVVRYLAAHYQTEERTIAIGYGEEKPIADNSTTDGRQKNRRVQIVNVGSAN